VHLPVDSDGDEGKDAGWYCTGCTELRKDAPRVAELPVVVQQIDEVEERVEDGLQHVGERQVDQEVVGDVAHAPMSDNDPDDDSVSAHSDGDHDDERDGVTELNMPVQHVRIVDISLPVEL